ncbi:MAG: adenylate kinase [Clostridia bacterium]|nr:adenylate kinase [Clostridia bacterium]MBQ3506033.1 adenylate kinase [Clostridia bacterium]
MNIILLGAPGAGKGTLASKIVDEYKLPHISTGDIFRENIKNQTPIGVVAKSYIDKGQLVPDEVTCQIVEERLTREDCKNGYMLDGFPRTNAQAEALDKITNVELVINIDVDFSLLMGRLCGRRVCKDCGESYHITRLNGATTCSRCGGELYQRKDDNPETVQSRLDVYNAQTAPLIEYYTKQGKIFNVNGSTTPEDVFEKVAEKLNALRK